MSYNPNAGGGPSTPNVRTISTSATVTASDDILLIDPASGGALPYNATLPAANSVPAGFSVTLKDIGGICTGGFDYVQFVRGVGSGDTIDGTTISRCDNAYQSITLISDGVSRWGAIEIAIP